MRILILALAYLLLLCSFLFAGIPYSGRQESVKTQEEIRNWQEVDLYISIIMQMARHSNPDVRQMSIRVMRTISTEYNREKILTYLVSLLEIERNEAVKAEIIKSVNEIMRDM
jgi:hypothetical protein